MGKKVGWVLLLALVIPACATDSDARLNDQNIKAGEYIEQNSVQPDIKQAGKDVKLNSKSLAKNVVGDVPADQAKPYTPENSKQARDDSDKSHAGGFWSGLTGGLLAGALFIIAAARSPLARLIPGVGTILTSLDSTFGALETWMQKMKDSGKPELADGLSNVLAAAHEDAKVSPYAAKLLAKVKLADAAPEPVHDAALFAAVDVLAARTPEPEPAAAPTP